VYRFASEKDSVTVYVANAVKFSLDQAEVFCNSVEKRTSVISCVKAQLFQNSLPTFFATVIY